METNTGILPPIKMESLPMSSPPPPSLESNLTKQEQPDNTHTVDIKTPPFVNSINELRSLSTAMSTFLRRYDELHDHLNFIKTSIDSKLPNHLLYTANPNQSALTPLTETSSAHTITPVPGTMVPEQNPNGTATNLERSHENVRKPGSPDFSKPKEIDISKEHEETDISEKPEETDASMKPEETHTSKKPEETHISKKPKKTRLSKKPVVSELEKLCETMCGRGIRKYVATHISDTNKLLLEMPKALKFAEDPAKLVLGSIGRFFVQGSRAYVVKGSHMIVGRLASVAILQCFLMMSSDGIEIAKEEEEYAAAAAVDWRRRMIREGGLAKADEADARGLLLLISGFGIPDPYFKNEDIRDLIRASNVKGISTALRRSIILIPKIPEVIDWMVKNNLEVEAADIAYTFGLEDKCHPQTILTTFLHNTIKDRQHESSAQMKVEMKKQLSDLKSIRKCLDAHKVDPSKLLPDCKINEKIQLLEKEISELYWESDEEEATRKRKAKGAESSRMPKQQEAKRTCLSGHENVPQEQKGNDHYGKSSYNGYLDGKLPSDYISAYSTSSVSHASGLPENTTSLLAIERGGGMLTGSYGMGVYGGTFADQMVNTTNGRPYGNDWHENSALIEKYLGQTYPRQVQTYDLQPSTTGLINLYSRPSGRSSLEAFPGLPNSSPSSGFSARAGPASDLYSFADTIVEDESYQGSHAAGSGTMRRSYFY